MTNKPLSIAMSFVAAVLPGCVDVRAVEITEPARSATIVAPVTTYKLQFAQAYIPNTFSAYLNGQDVSGNVMPAATPGGATTLWMWDGYDYSFTGGTPDPGTGASYSGGIYGVNPSAGSSDKKPSKSVTTPIYPPPVSGGPASNCPVPQFTWYKQKLEVSAGCSARFCDTTDELEFYPVHVVATPRVKEIPLYGRVGVTVQAFPPITAPLQVRLQPTNGRVSVNDQPAGTATYVTIPPGGCGTAFTLTGKARGEMTVFVEAAGIMRSTVSGSVY